MVDEIDADGNGEIDFDEFVTVMSRKVNTSYTPAQVKAAFKVFEKDTHFSVRPQGYGLTLQQGLAALDRLGLVDAARAADTPSTAHYVFDGGGRLVNAFSSKGFGSRAPDDAWHSWERRRVGGFPPVSPWRHART